MKINKLAWIFKPRKKFLENYARQILGKKRPGKKAPSEREQILSNYALEIKAAKE
ncbi:MAG: hypothetical protein WC781_05880 [Candidatus Pacearchaeota archaeon]|jgi:hypothetical protein